MVRLFVFLAAAQLVLLVLGLISCLAADRVRNLPRALWVLVILVVPLIGPMAYYGWGRPAIARPVSPRRPASPDDDPDFLRSMDSEQARRDRELLAQWENEVKKPPENREPDHQHNGDEKSP
ncbi:PLD nuclease N-terminal domain-containing protein [Actinoplanes sp. NPDC049265]|uniref:PLD nuclease N-terminal domain-containing protein n=1 Tax=Actinoplanes sp. NPDC049265 TaxID=3363902 RepID=UPI00372067F1